MKAFGLCLVLCLLVSPWAFAQNLLLHHHGRLVSEGDSPVQGQVSLTFSLYPEASGQASAVWSETRTLSLNGGVYSVALGSTEPLSASHFEGPRWLGVTVGGQPLLPRHEIGSVPRALVSEEARKLGGFEAQAFARVGQAVSFASVRAEELQAARIVGALEGRATEAGEADLAKALDAGASGALPAGMNVGLEQLRAGALPSNVSVGLERLSAGTLPSTIQVDAQKLGGQAAAEYTRQNTNVAFGNVNGAVITASSKFVGRLEGAADSLASTASGALPSGMTVALSQLGSGVLPSNITVNAASLGGVSAADVMKRIDELVPAGTVVAYAGATPPPGWLFCDGSLLKESDEPRLFAAIGTAHGTASDVTGFFRLPDYRGRFLRGVTNDTSRDPDTASRAAMAFGGNTGSRVGSVQGHQFGSHSHDLNIDENAGGAYGLSAAGQGGPTGAHARSTLLSGGSETRPVNAYVNWIIKR